ncbi:MAG: hypothetical protein J0L99_20280 [Chitinophagales bacterium]|nr:hypothetical protein [Chitinophagales bacterium]
MKHILTLLAIGLFCSAFTPFWGGDSAMNAVLLKGDGVTCPAKDGKFPCSIVPNGSAGAPTGIPVFFSRDGEGTLYLELRKRDMSMADKTAWFVGGKFQCLQPVQIDATLSKSVLLSEHAVILRRGMYPVQETKDTYIVLFTL